MRKKRGCAVPRGRTIPTSRADMPRILRHVWDDSPTGHAAHEVSSYLKRSDTRETLLRSFIDKEGGAPAPAKLNVFRVIDAATPGAIVKVIPGVSVVRLRWYHDAFAGGSEAGSQASSVAAKSATSSVA